MITKDPAINAYKYRNPGSTINIFSNIREGYFSLSVMTETVRTGGTAPARDQSG
jgi:hypothetical protein